MSRLLEIFRPEKKEMWLKLCEEIGADFVPGTGFRGKDSIHAHHKNWEIIIDTFKKRKKPTYTRIRALYVNRDSFTFRIFRKNLISGLQKMAGMQDVEVGYHEFDKDFIIQGNNEQKLRMLFRNEWIREIISLQPSISLGTVIDEDWKIGTFREGKSELIFMAPGIITDLDQLHDLYNLFGEMLNHLCHIGSAYEDDPSLL